MITKTLIAAAAVATLAAGLAAPAQAKVNVDLYLGGFGPGYYGYDGYYAPDYPVYHAPRHPRRHHYEEEYSRGISCDEGLREVSYAGFRKVRALDCSGKRFTYKARRNGERFIIKVSRRSGDIISVQPNY